MAALGATSHVEHRATLQLAATVIPINTISIEMVGDIAIADADVFGTHYHRAFVVDNSSVITANADGLRIDDETALVSR
jgi:hypothetical protein